MSMAEILDFVARRAERLQDDAQRLGAPRTAMVAQPMEFLFDPTSPFSYLALERVERSFPRATWRVADGRRFPPIGRASCERAERRAAALRIPLRWPARGGRVPSGAPRRGGPRSSGPMSAATARRPAVSPRTRSNRAAGRSSPW